MDFYLNMGPMGEVYTSVHSVHWGLAEFYNSFIGQGRRRDIQEEYCGLSGVF